MNKNIFDGQMKDGKKYIVRYAEIGDTQDMCKYMNTISQEQTYIRFQGEEITPKEECEYMENFIKKMDEHLSVKLVAICEGKIVGISDIKMNDKIASHEGVFGITVAKEYRGQGIGKRLMELVLQEAVKNIPQLRIVTLAVFGNNLTAYEMYKKCGFLEYGRLPEGIHHKGQYVDHVYMYKKVN